MRGTARGALIAASPGLDAGAAAAVVVVPTFRRPAMLAETLRSLLAQSPAVAFAVLVVENDARHLAGLAAARPFFEAGGLAGGCILEPAQGNVWAINAGFAAALTLFPAAEFILMMDDDEVASPGWIATMVDAARQHGADIVGGPVLPHFAPEAPRLVRAHPVFWPAYHDSGPVPMIYGSGNCLIRRRVFARMGEPAFDPRFNYLGGGDVDFFVRCRAAGFSSHWEEAATIVETVPPERTRVSWILRRGLRIGAINRALDLRARPGRAGVLRVLAKDLLILPLSAGRALAALVRTGNPLIAAHPIVIALGRLASGFGLEPEQYRAGRQG